MKDYRSIVIKLIIFIIILILIIFLVLNYIYQSKNENTKNKKQDDINIKVTYNEDDDYTGYGRFYEEKQYSVLNSYEEFYMATQCINKYINYAVNQKNVNKAYMLLDTSCTKDITYSKLEQMYSEYSEGNYYLRAKNIYSKSIYGVHVYYIYGDLVRNEESKGIEKVSEFNSALILDFNNFTFSVIPNIKEEELEKLNLYKNIDKKMYNQIIYSEITDNEKLSNYAKYYLEEVKLNSKNAFNMLDDNYRLKRFNNSFEEFTKFIEENYYINTSFNISSRYTDFIGRELYNKFYIYENGTDYLEDKEESNINSTGMQVVDKNYLLDKSIIMKETAANNFKVMLDRYTIETDIMKKLYEELTEDEKIAYQCENIIDSIITKNYNYIYEHYIENEKNKFDSIQRLKETFDEISLNGFYIENYNIQKSDKDYTYVADLKNATDEQSTKKAVIKINLGVEMNFNILTLNIS